jgi:hypothetical protein
MADKSTLRILQVKLIDGRLLKIPSVDRTLTSSELSNLVCEKLDIKYSDEFSLSKPCPETMKKSSTVNIYFCFCLSILWYKSSTNILGPWLDDDKTLDEQDIGEDVILELEKRFFFHDEYIVAEDISYFSTPHSLTPLIYLILYLTLPDHSLTYHRPSISLFSLFLVLYLTLLVLFISSMLEQIKL